VLLIACANVATLLLSRAAARQKEMAIRTALGATRTRLVRQMLTESLLLTLAGGSLGLLLASWARNLMLSLVPSSIALPAHVPLNGSVLAFALGVSVLAAVFFGLVPAFQVSPSSTQAPLQETGRSATISHSHHRIQNFFVAGEFALALVLLIGAGLLIRSFGRLVATSPGFQPDHLLTLNVPLPREAYSHAAQVQDFYKELLARVSNLPGVQSASLSNDLPLENNEYVAFSVEGRGNAEGTTPKAIFQSWILGSYFQTMGVPLIQGRWFRPEDVFGSQQVAVVSVTAAREFWPGENAIGKRIRWGVNGPWQTVVGIVGDVKEGPLNSVLRPHVYRPYLQMDGGFLESDPFSDMHAMNIALRTEVDPASLASAVVTEVHSFDRDLAVVKMRTMTQLINSSVAGPEFNMVLLGGLAGLAILLAAIGVYGVLTYVVAEQTRELGIRMALGAEPRDIFGLILGRGARLAGIGAGVGLVAALALTRFMKSLLYGVSAIDPFTFLSVVALLVVVALAACYIPARRALTVEPMMALRHE
jgi:putative ABC transport system permease protein